jgi:GT2 family glycosyltransferase
MESIKVSVIILNYNTKEVTLNCIKSLVKNTKSLNFEIILVDNGSSEKFQILGSTLSSNYNLQNIKVIRNKKNLGFAKANNHGIKIAKGQYVLLLNSDTIIHDDVISGMAKWMDKNPEVGISSCMLKNRDGTVQGTGGYFPTLLRVFSWMTIEDLPFLERLIKPFHPQRSKSFYKNSAFYQKEREVDWLTGAFLFIRKEVFQNIGLIDEDYFMYTEDTDFCFRAKRAGWKVMYLPKWSITHLGGASSTAEFPIISEYNGVKLFYKKHYPAWQFPFLRLSLKLGALWRTLVLGIIYGKEAASTYARAFRIA